MKAIMISIKPKWCAKIMNGEKTIEVRKNKALANAIKKLIDENGYAEIYVYCSKDKKETKPLLIKNRSAISNNPLNKYEIRLCNGKVIFKFRCYKVEDFPYISDEYDKLIGSCLSEKELLDYSTIKFENGIRLVKTIYAIHISDLEIFDRPKYLSEFYTVGYLEALENSLKAKPFPISSQFIQNQYLLRRAPQNMVYIEIEDSTHI